VVVDAFAQPLAAQGDQTELSDEDLIALGDLLLGRFGHVEHVERQVVVAQRVGDLKQLGLQFASANAIGQATRDDIEMRNRALMPPTAKPVHKSRAALRLDALADGALEQRLHLRDG